MYYQVDLPPYYYACYVTTKSPTSTSTDLTDLVGTGPTTGDLVLSFGLMLRDCGPSTGSRKAKAD